MELSSNVLPDDELKAFLDEKASQYERADFVADDPISVPHLFSKKEDVEVAGLLASTISWGNRKAIVKKAHEMMNFLDNDPHNFVVNASEGELERLRNFVYRTFQNDDLAGMVRGLRHIYNAFGQMENLFAGGDVRTGIARLRSEMLPHLSPRTHRHISNVESGSACKRINMFLRWMVRKSTSGVDFGLWSCLDASQLLLPLDVHTGNVGRRLGLLSRRQNDWKAVEEITSALRRLDPSDPTKYDFALFGLGIFEHWK